MKSVKIFLTVSVLLLIMSACGTGMTTEEVVKKAIDTSIESYQSKATADVSIIKDRQSTDMSLDGDFTFFKEPFFMHLKSSDWETDVEMYMNQETAYILNDNNQWVEVPVEDNPDLAAIPNDMLSADLSRVNKFVELFTVEKDGNDYNLIVNITDDTSKELEKEFVNDIFKDLIKLELEDYKIIEFEYILTLDKDFKPKNIHSKTIVTLSYEGDTVRLESEANEKIFNVNSLQALTIPTEITSNSTSIMDE
jgi:DNA-directed RNA polymerase alpha subunit